MPRSSFGELRTARFGHDHIGNQKLNGAPAISSAGAGLQRVRRFQHAIAAALHGFADQGADHLVVFHQQDGLRAAHRRQFGRLRFQCCRRAIDPRQVDAERCAQPGQAGQLHPAATLFDDAGNGIQSQARSRARRALVVKKGSKACARVASSMPAPLSFTVSTTYAPGFTTPPACFAP